MTPLNSPKRLPQNPLRGRSKLAGVVYLIYLLSAFTLLHAAQSPLKRRMSEAALMAAKWMNVAKYFWARAKPWMAHRPVVVVCIVDAIGCSIYELTIGAVAQDSAQHCSRL